MQDNTLEELLIREHISYESDVDLKKKTWIHRGGRTKFFIMPNDISKLQIIMSYLYTNNIPHLVVGATSNLFILNSTDIPVVISTLKCKSFEIKEGYIECDCGVLVSKLAYQMVNEGIKGFEYLTKLPGTIGGAICNNSSVKSQSNSITTLLVDFDIITPDGIKRLKADDLHLTFRSSDLKKHLLHGTILRARLKVNQGDSAEMRQIVQSNEDERHHILEGPTQNLGCTVHKMYCNGAMPRRYAIPYKLYQKITSLLIGNMDKRKRLNKQFLLTISGHRALLPYVSDKQLITFIWRDERADDYFYEYLAFMKDVCKTDQIEIEVIK